MTIGGLPPLPGLKVLQKIEKSGARQRGVHVGMENMEQEIVEPARRPDADRKQHSALQSRQLHKNDQCPRQRDEKSEKDALGDNPAF